MKTHERTGSGRAVSAAGRMNGLLVKLNPLKVRLLYKSRNTGSSPSR